MREKAEQNGAVVQGPCRPCRCTILKFQRARAYALIRGLLHSLHSSTKSRVFSVASTHEGPFWVENPGRVWGSKRPFCGYLTHFAEKSFSGARAYKVDTLPAHPGTKVEGRRRASMHHLFADGGRSRLALPGYRPDLHTRAGDANRQARHIAQEWCAASAAAEARAFEIVTSSITDTLSVRLKAKIAVFTGFLA